MATGAFQKKFHFQRIGGDDGVVIGREGFFHNRSHAIEANRSGISAHLTVLFAKPPPIARFVANSAHFGMVIAKAKDAEEIGTRKNDAPADLRNPHQLANKGLRLIYVLKDIERANARKVLIRKRQLFPIIELAAIGEFT